MEFTIIESHTMWLDGKEKKNTNEPVKELTNTFHACEHIAFVPYTNSCFHENQNEEKKITSGGAEEVDEEWKKRERRRK